MIGWHTYGLYYRAEKNYAEAVKCYKKALGCTKEENLVILRDLGSLQMQIRDYDGIVKTRQAVLKQRPQMNMHWVQLAVAAHVAGNQVLAEETLDGAIKRLRSDRETFVKENQSAAHEKKRAAVQALQRDWLQSRHELSELIMYRVQMYAEDGQYAEGVEYMRANAADIADKLGMREQTAALLLKAQRYAEAAAAYETLLRINSDNLDYHRGYLAAKLEAADAGAAVAAAPYDAVKAHCAALQAAYAGSRLTQVFCLTLLRGADYAELFERVLVENVRRGVPSMYQVLKPTLDTAERVAAVRALLERMLASLAAHGTFDGQPARGEREAPACTLWTTLFAAQFCARHGELARARALVAAAERHTPTAVEVYMVKAKVLARAGDAAGAAEAFEHARKMDLADRYLNNKATKYLLRANRPAAATGTISLFLKGEEHGTPHQLLAGTQCSWFEWELGQCYERLGDAPRALKRYASICDHFAGHVQESFDYNYYAFRKNTVRAYEQLLRFTETLPERPMYRRATLRAVELYLEIAARRAADPAAAAAAADARAAFARADEERERRRRTAPAPKSGADAPPEPDADPDGLRLASAADPLADAQRLMDEMLANTRNPRVPLHMPAAVYSTAARLALARGRPADAAALVRRAAETAAANKDDDYAHATVVRAALLVLAGAPADCAGLDWVRAHVLAEAAEVPAALEHALAAARTLPACVELLRAAERVVAPEQHAQQRAALAAHLERFPDAALGALVDAARFVQGSALFDDAVRGSFLAHCRSRFPGATVFDLVEHPRQEEEEPAPSSPAQKP